MEDCSAVPGLADDMVPIVREVLVRTGQGFLELLGVRHLGDGFRIHTQASQIFGNMASDGDDDRWVALRIHSQHSSCDAQIENERTLLPGQGSVPDASRNRLLLIEIAQMEVAAVTIEFEGAVWPPEMVELVRAEFDFKVPLAQEGLESVAVRADVDLSLESHEDHRKAHAASVTAPRWVTRP